MSDSPAGTIAEAAEVSAAVKQASDALYAFHRRTTANNSTSTNSGDGDEAGGVKECVMAFQKVCTARLRKLIADRGRFFFAGLCKVFSSLFSETHHVRSVFACVRTFDFCSR